MALVKLLNRPPSKRVAVDHPVIGLDPGNHHQHHRAEQFNQAQTRAEQLKGSATRAKGQVATVQ